MLFLTHLVAAVLLGKVTRLSTPWLVVGAALPDIVDKPLGLLGVVDLFHSVGHSGLVVLLLVPVALTGRPGLAVAAGWLSHLVLDALHVVVNGRPGDALFLGWPLTVPSDPLAIPPGSFVWYYLGTPSFYLGVGLWVALAVVLASERWSREDAVAE